jgi:hypothetical protein
VIALAVIAIPGVLAARVSPTAILHNHYIVKAGSL